jgi:alkylated DNA repair dioxygenase AlkB
MGPVIASVSPGAERLFRLKGKMGGCLCGTIAHGCLLIMAGKTQENFKHDAPKEPDVAQPRINLTFRHVEHM